MDNSDALLLGLRTLIYPAPDLDAAKAWFTDTLGFGPYFDEPFYVEFNVGGYELGLLPDADPQVGPMTYWGVADADRALESLLTTGATVHEPVSDVGAGIRTAVVRSPVGVLLGVIENPSFSAADTPSSGPGR